MTYSFISRFAAFSLVLASVVPSHTPILAAEIPTLYQLTPPPVHATKVAPPAKVKLPAWKTYTYQGLSFRIPSQWTAKVEPAVEAYPDYYSVQFMKGGKRVADFQCQVPAIGFPGYDEWYSRTRKVENDKVSYSVSLTEAKSSGPEKLRMVYLSLENKQTSCFIFLGKDPSKVGTTIFESVRSAPKK